VELLVKVLSVALLFLAVVSSAAAAEPDQAGAQAAEPPAQGTTADDDEEIVVEGEVPKEKRRVCQMRTETGSIMPKRVCRTVAQMEADEQAARETMERVNRDREARDAIQANRDTGV
jgi:hypothetical protein